MRGPVPKERIMQQFDTPAAITAVLDITARSL